ncbi:hypothetical protein ACTFIV_007972 [Dictyostelium citrinum]
MDNNNNENNSNNNRDIYKLYKSVFNNKYLSNLIFNYVYEFNEQIYYSGNQYSDDCCNFFRYHQANFQWCVNKSKRLLFYKIKRNEKFNEIPIGSFKTFLGILSELSKEESSIILNQFLSTNQSILKPIAKDLFHISIELVYFNLLKFVFENYYKESPTSTSTSTSTSISNIRIDENIFDKSLSSGDLNIIRYIYYEIGIKVKCETIAFYNALNSSNRSQVIRFLLDEIHFIPPSSYTGDFENYFDNLVRLDHQLFKRLYNDFNIPLLQFKGLQSLYFYNKSYFFQCEEGITKKSQQSQIDFIMNVFFVMSVSHRTNIEEKRRSSLLLKKVNHLIEYNENRNIQIPFKHILKTKEIIKENQTSIKINSIYNNMNSTSTTNFNNNNNNSSSTISNNKNNNTNNKWYNNILSNINSFFKNDINSNNNNNNNNNNIENEEDYYFNDKEFVEIVYKDFDLIREIKRVYFFDWLSKNRNSNNEIELLIFQFVSEYNEHQMLNYPIEDGNGLARVACFFADCKLLTMNKNHSAIIQTQVFFNYEKVDIQSQFQFLKTAILYTDFKDLKLISHIINPLNNQFIIEKHADQLADIIFSIEKRFSAIALIGNRELFKYYFKNFKSLFIWDGIDICKGIINSFGNGNNNNTNNNNEDDDFQFLQYIFDNGIGNIKDDSLLSLCINRSVAEYMVNNFSLKFQPKCFNNFRHLSLWRSNYLMFYFFDNIDLKNPEFISILSGNTIMNLDYKTSRYLYSKLKENNVDSINYTLMEKMIFNLSHIIQKGSNLIVIKKILQDFENCIDPIEKSKFNLTIIPNYLTLLENKISKYDQYKDFIKDKIDNKIIKTTN